MNSINSRTLICMTLVLLVAIPVHSAQLGKEVIIECFDGKNYSGVLVEVSQDVFRVYENNKIKNIKTLLIRRIGVRRNSRFLSSISRGFIIGGSLGALGGIINEVKGGEGMGLLNQLFYIGFAGAVIGGVFSFTMSKFKYYKFHSLSETRKAKLLKKLKRRL